MKLIPITSAPNQSFHVLLGDQNCSVTLYQKSTGLFMDLESDNKQILQTQICLDRVFMVRYDYLGFVGNLFFYDSQGLDDPTYSGLGSRYLLAYFDQSEIDANNAALDAIISAIQQETPPVIVPPVEPIPLLLDGSWMLDGSQTLNGLFTNG